MLDLEILVRTAWVVLDPAPVIARRPGARRVADAIRTSVLFDEAHYRAQLRPGEEATDAALHLVTDGASRGLDPHPLFDAALVTRRHPEAADHPGGPLGWYLADQSRRVAPPTTLLTADEAPTPAAYTALVRDTLARHAAARDHRDVPRTSPTFDHEAGDAHVAAMADVVAGLDDPPLVSVVVPTKDRAAVLPAAVASVLGQTYPDLELLVVDDGSTDGTADVLAELAASDPRVRTFHQPNAGVSAARNHGLREAKGRLVAYLDSDNTWVPTFVATMVGTLAATGARAGYAGSELRSGDRLEYRGRPHDHEVLLERNYIDCITLVHERTLIDEVGGFDETLPRVVDWDLLLRLSAATELVYAPFVATSYDLWDEAGERISTTVSRGYIDVVRLRYLLSGVEPPEPVPGRDSLVLVARAADDDPAGEVAAAIRAHRAAAAATGRDLEVVVVDSGTDRSDALRLRLLDVVLAPAAYHRTGDRLQVAGAADLGASSASGDVLLFADAALHVDPTTLARCADVVRAGGATAAQPLLTSTSDGTVVSSGWRTADRGLPVQVGWQLAPHDALVTRRTDRDAVDLAACAVATDAFRRVDGFDPVFVRAGAAIDLGHRVRSDGGRCSVVGDAVADVDPAAYHARWRLASEDPAELARRHGDAQATLTTWTEGTGTVVTGVIPVPRAALSGPQRWAATVGRVGDRGGGPRRWSLAVPALDPSERHATPEWELAVALRDALADLGEHAVVDLRRAWHRPTAVLDDVTILLRGRHPADVRPGRPTVLWVLGAVADLPGAEVDRADAVIVGDEGEVPALARRARRPAVGLPPPGSATAEACATHAAWLTAWADEHLPLR